MFFHDASLCFQGWQSCASCHPSQGRVDGLNWDLLNDGIGNPKNTKSLLLSHQTPPAMATGVRADAETAVRSGCAHPIHDRGRSPMPRRSTRICDLQAVPSPHLEDGRLSGGQRGQRLFASARMHPLPLRAGNDQRQSFDVGTGGRKRATVRHACADRGRRTAPYLHDGRAATIREVLAEHNPGDRHGMTSDLSEKQLDDLTEYLLSR